MFVGRSACAVVSLVSRPNPRERQLHASSEPKQPGGLSFGDNDDASVPLWVPLERPPSCLPA